MLLITTAMSAIGTTMIDKEVPISNPGRELPLQLWGKDQEQTHQEGWAFNIFAFPMVCSGF